MTADAGSPQSYPGASLETDPAARWRLTEELFHRAMDCPPEVRTQTLSEWCGPDTDLLTAILALIEADSCVENLIASAPSIGQDGLLAREPDELTLEGQEETSEQALNDPWLGRELGAFRLTRLLGRGGMGVVYLGERISGGFTQQVAVKLVGKHLRSSPAVTQFLLERETLAQLQHDNIARLLDGGVTSEGFPYVVMEYVEGRRLDHACDDPATNVEQILRWMIQLCNAVTYVHRNLILHRDLKPGNVMVTSNGQVKLLDFGTLKRIGPEGQIDSAMTQAGMRPVTLRYASPEHVEGSTVSTATDVYSLGMMLYRLIAGRLPIELDDLPIGQYLQRLKAGSGEPPSQVALKSKTVRAIDQQTASDLDAIVAKAIRYESEARYPTTSALADDLKNLLTQRPVAARNGNLHYHAAKFYRRNRGVLLTSAAALLVLAGGLSAMAWQGHLAHLQQLRADKGVEDERQLAHMLLFDYFDALEAIPGSVDAQRKAATQALAYLDNLAKIAPGSSLELDTIRGYTDMGNLLGNPYSANLGNVPEAKLVVAKGLNLAETRLHKHPHDLPSMRAMAKADLAAGELYLGNGDAVTGERYLRSGADLSAQMASDPHVTADMLVLAASVTESLGHAYDPGRGMITADLTKAVDAYLLSDKYDELCQQIDPKNALCRFGLPVGQYQLGMLVEDSDPALAATHFRQGLTSVDKFPAEDRAVARTLRVRNYLSSRLALVLIRTGHAQEGMQLARHVQKSFRDIIAHDGLNNRALFDLVAFETDLGVTYHMFSKETEAEESARDALDLLKTLLLRSPDNIRWKMIEAQNRMTYGRVEIKLGHTQVAEQSMQKGMKEAVELAQSKDASPEVLEDAADDLVELHLHPEDAALALTFANRAVKAYARPTPSQLITLAKAQLAVGNAKEASTTAQQALAQLSDPTKSRIIADEAAEAHKLILQ